MKIREISEEALIFAKYLRNEKERLVSTNRKCSSAPQNAGSLVNHTKHASANLKPRNAQSANGSERSHNRRRELSKLIIACRKLLEHAFKKQG